MHSTHGCRDHSSGPIAARPSALTDQIRARELRAAVTCVLYICGLALMPVIVLRMAVGVLGFWISIPVVLLVLAALTQRVVPAADGRVMKGVAEEEEESPDGPAAPLPELGTALEATLERLATRVGAPMPATVWLTPSIFAAGWIPVLRWHFTSWSVTWVPVLMLGVLPMRVMGRDELESILSHELGHLTRAPSPLTALFMITQRLAEGLMAGARMSMLQRWLNPAVWWTRLWFRALDQFVISMGRLEELRADEVAVRAVGPVAHKRALETYVTSLCRIRALAERHLEVPEALRHDLHEYFRVGARVLPPADAPEVKRRLRRFHGTLQSSHPSAKAREFMAARVTGAGTTIQDDDGAGVLHLLPPQSLQYLPVLVRWLVKARVLLARQDALADGPWSACQDQRSRLLRPQQEDLLCWRRQDAATNLSPLAAPILSHFSHDESARTHCIH